MNWDTLFALKVDLLDRAVGINDVAYDYKFVADTVLDSSEPGPKKAKSSY